jgi:hypothetical protein
MIESFCALLPGGVLLELLVHMSMAYLSVLVCAAL